MINISNKDELGQLVAKYLHGQASQEEIRFLHLYYDHFDDRSDGLSHLTKSERERLKSEIMGAIDKKMIYVVASKRNMRWLNYAAASVVLLVMGALAIWQFNLKWGQVSTQQITTMDATENVQYSFVAEDEALHHYLPDGSYVMMEPGSEISYSSDFSRPERIVKLNGVAFFDIQHDEGRPFVVMANGVSTRVLGTSFKISSEESKQEFSISVTSGKVEISDRNKQLAILEKNDQMVMDMTTLEITKTRLKDEQVAQLEPSVYVMDNITVGEALDVISKRWDCEFEVLNGGLYGCTFTTSFLPSDNLKEIVTVISAVIGANYHIEGRMVRLEGKGCQD